MERDPHAWQSVANAKIYVANIRDALIAADPAGKATYEANAAAYLAKLDALDAEVRAASHKIPADRRSIITTHDAFGYFAAAYGMAFIAPQGVSTEAEVSAKDVAKIITPDQEAEDPGGVPGERHRHAAAQAHRARKRRAVGGTLYSDALTDEKGDAPLLIIAQLMRCTMLTSSLSARGARSAAEHLETSLAPPQMR